MRPLNLRLIMFWERALKRILATLLAVVFLISFIGCAQLSRSARHGRESPDYENTYLSTSSPLGAKALLNWRNYDIDVRKFLRKNKDPDVIFSKFAEVTFFYLKEKVQVKFVRPGVGLKTKKEQTRIPQSLYLQLRQKF